MQMIRSSGLFITKILDDFFGGLALSSVLYYGADHLPEMVLPMRPISVIAS